MKTESILLLRSRNTPQPQRQTSPQSTGLGYFFNQMYLKKQAGGAILISNKIDFKLRSIKRDKEGHFIFLTGKKIHQEKIPIMNIYVPPS